MLCDRCPQEASPILHSSVQRDLDDGHLSLGAGASSTCGRRSSLGFPPLHMRDLFRRRRGYRHRTSAPAQGSGSGRMSLRRLPAKNDTRSWHNPEAGNARRDHRPCCSQQRAQRMPQSCTAVPACMRHLEVSISAALGGTPWSPNRQRDRLCWELCWSWLRPCQVLVEVAGVAAHALHWHSKSCVGTASTRQAMLRLTPGSRSSRYPPSSAIGFPPAPKAS